MYVILEPSAAPAAAASGARPTSALSAGARAPDRPPFPAGGVRVATAAPGGMQIPARACQGFAAGPALLCPADEGAQPLQRSRGHQAGWPPH